MCGANNKSFKGKPCDNWSNDISPLMHLEFLLAVLESSYIWLYCPNISSNKSFKAK